MGQFHALIGDVKASKKAQNRREQQHELRALLDRAQRDFQPHLTGPLDITGGDEFKGLFDSGDGAFRCAYWLSQRAPFPIRFGLGRGELSVGDPQDPPGQLDGACFHRARQAVERARRQDHWLVVNGYQSETRPALDILLNAVLALEGRVREDWTSTQKHYVELVEGRLQTEVAAEVGVKPSSVSQVLKAAKWHEVSTVRKEIAFALKQTDVPP